MPMERIRLEPNTTLYPVPVVLITCGADEERNVFSLNRISSCNAEPPMVAISVRPGRASHDSADPSGQRQIKPDSRMAKMAAKLKRAGWRSRYRLRKQTVEPVIGQIKQARGFRQFLLRGFIKVQAEWALICTAHNLTKLVATRVA